LDIIRRTIYSDYIRNLYYEGRLDEARQESLKLMQMDPNCGRARYELGLVLEEEGKLDEAIAEFKLALKSQPDNRRTEARARLAREVATRAIPLAAIRADRSCVQEPSVGSEISGVVKKPWP
jgi:tetratricopeptide (TPR) repeat protein